MPLNTPPPGGWQNGVMANDPSVAGGPAQQPDERLVQRQIVAIGASAGGVEALSTLFAGLPPELPVALLVAVHVLPTATSMLPAILERAGKLHAKPARHGDRLERGCIYVAPPDHHLLVRDGTIELSHGPRENGHRPALDPLFRSVARSFGNRAIGALLSGTLDDGAAGLWMLRESGGATIAQDPEDALYPGMPRSAIANGAAAYVVKISGMAHLICELIDSPIEPEDGPAASEPAPAATPTLETAELTSPRSGEATGLTCPECGGALWEHYEGDLIRFRCHVGHAYSPDSMQTEQSRALEAALWSALRSLEERQDLLQRMARRSSGGRTAARFERRVEDVRLHADTLRRTIAELGFGSPAVAEPEEEPAA